jgi:hypothetical protein
MGRDGWDDVNIKMNVLLCFSSSRDWLVANVARLARILPPCWAVVTISAHCS